MPDECNLVIVPAPVKPYLEPELKLLKDYLQGGGRAVFLLAARRGPELVPLLADYGIHVGNDVVVDQVLRLFQGPALGVEPIVTELRSAPHHRRLHAAHDLPIHALRRRCPGQEARRRGHLARQDEPVELGRGRPRRRCSTRARPRSTPRPTARARSRSRSPLRVTTKQGDKDVASRLVAFGSDGVRRQQVPQQPLQPRSHAERRELGGRRGQADLHPSARGARFAHCAHIRAGHADLLPLGADRLRSCCCCSASPCGVSAAACDGELDEIPQHPGVRGVVPRARWLSLLRREPAPRAGSRAEEARAASSRTTRARSRSRIRTSRSS